MSNSLFLPIIVSFKIRQRRKNILLERSMDLLYTSPPFSWTELISCYYFQWDGNKPCKPLALSSFTPCTMNWKQAFRGLPIYTEAAWLPVSFPYFNEHIHWGTSQSNLQVPWHMYCLSCLLRKLLTYEKERKGKVIIEY